jgi:hypothetical protein
MKYLIKKLVGVEQEKVTRFCPSKMLEKISDKEKIKK